MDVQRRNGASGISIGGGTRAHDWPRIANEAREYLTASAWQRAHDVLSRQTREHGKDDHFPEEALECLCLYVASCWRLDAHSSYTAGIQWIRDMTTGSPASGHTNLMAAHCLAQAEANVGNYKQARNIVEAIPESSFAASNNWDVARLELLLARLDIREVRLEEAEEHGLRAARLARDAESTGLQGDAFAVLGCIAKMRGRFVGSGALCAEAAQHYWRAGDLAGHAAALLNRAIALLQIGFVRDAESLFREALERSMALERKSTALRAKLGLAETSIRIGSLENSRRLLLGAWREARRLRMKREEVLALEFISETHLLMGAISKARISMSLCKRAVQRLAPSGDIALEIRIRDAMLALAEKRPWKAIARARGALKHANKIRMPWEKAQAYRMLGIALVYHGRKAHAREAFIEAEKCFSELGEILERRVVEAWLRALDMPSTRAIKKEKIHRLERELANSSADTGGAQGHSEPGSFLEILRFWLNHPLLGPIPWLLGKGKQKPRSSAEPPAPTSHDATPSADGMLPRMELCPLWANLGLLTQTQAVVNVLQLAETYAPGEIPVLLLGETGTGKDLLAQGLHKLSGRHGQWVPINCAAARRDLFVAELFGARRGSYTGSISDRRGLIEEADGGTVFFDEVADLDLEAQGFLLRFLDSGEVRSLGDTRSRTFEARVVAATCRDMGDLVISGQFRADLYARLAALIFRIPPLRDRRADLPLLQMELWCRGGGLPHTWKDIFTARVQDELCTRSWPGNVRELKHLVDRVRIYAEMHGARAAREKLLKGEFSEDMGSIQEHPPMVSSCESSGPVSPSGTSNTALRPRDVSKTEYREALDAAGGSVLEAGRLLGLPRSTAYRLHAKFRRLGSLEDPEFDGQSEPSHE